MIALQGRSDQEIETIRNTEILLDVSFQKNFISVPLIPNSINTGQF